MKKFLQKKLNQKGLTLVELLAVIVILGIIAAIAVPAIGNIINNSKVNAMFSDGQNAISAGQIYFAESTEDSVTLKVLKDEGFLEDIGKLGETGTIDKASGEVNEVSITATAINGSITVGFVNAKKSDISAADSKKGNGTMVTVDR
ncbi:prepilin-type N-terminal cleavage/methylation domain-containing protein [Sporosarcina ureae]|uniref:prepilin-type N-terminal cleavage/methylation domain-containing protein n=1 Tax=Sporosarcina ureae TaxID=1571 RepID=UPI0028AA6C08|nr:prepilin-type N-terminal cleavage/methylation domain-containing protein [Sporosarcina ureae]